MFSGYQLILSAAFKNSSLLERISINHCFEGIISISLPQRSCTATVCVMLFDSDKSPFQSLFYFITGMLLLNIKLKARHLD